MKYDVCEKYVVTVVTVIVLDVVKQMLKKN